MRKANVFVGEALAGTLLEDERGYRFLYLPDYVKTSDEPVSLTLPVRAEPYYEKTLFAFFDGLIPEGWLLEIAEKSWKVNPRDRMGLLLATCFDCIGNVRIQPVEAAENE